MTMSSKSYLSLFLENGVERWKVDAVRALRDTVPIKPKKFSWTLKEWTEKVAVLREMSIGVLEDKWTEEEFSEELEKFKTHDSEYSYHIVYSREMAEKIEDKMLIYEIMGHEQDCSALSFLKSYSHRNDDGDYSIELVEMHGANRFKILCYGATKTDVLERYKNQDRQEEKSPREKKNPFKVYRRGCSNYFILLRRLKFL